MAIIYSYQKNTNIEPTDTILGTTTQLVNGKPKNQTKSFIIGELASYITNDYVPYNDATSNVNLGIYSIGSSYGLYSTELSPGGIRFGYSGSYGTLTSNLLSSDHTYQLPDANGTIALLDDFAGFVPYNGASDYVDLGNNSLYTTGNSGTGVEISPDGTIYLRSQSTNDAKANLRADLLAGDETYQLPNGSGTLALSSDIKFTSLTTTGSSGPATLASGVLNIPQYSGGGSTYSFTTPLVDTAGTITINQASTSVSGYLSNTDWNTFNNKQVAITTGTTAQYFRGDLSLATFPTIPSVGTWGALNYPTWTTGTPFVKMTAAGTFALDTNAYLTSVGTGTTNEITYWSGTNTLGSLTTATYPSLTELSYIKGVTSGVQTQLNAKQATLVYTPYRYLNTTQSTTTGTVTETVVATATIAAGAFNSNDIMKMFFQASKATTTSNVTLRIKIGSTSTFASATTIATYTFLLANGFVTMQRAFSLAGGNINCSSPTSSLLTDVFATSGALTAIAANPANTLYVFFSVQLGTAGDSVNFTMAYISN